MNNEKNITDPTLLTINKFIDFISGVREQKNSHDMDYLLGYICRETIKHEYPRLKDLVRRYEKNLNNGFLKKKLEMNPKYFAIRKKWSAEKIIKLISSLPTFLMMKNVGEEGELTPIQLYKFALNSKIIQEAAKDLQFLCCINHREVQNYSRKKHSIIENKALQPA